MSEMSEKGVAEHQRLVNTRRAFFIKLGRGGEWEKECIERGELQLGYDLAPHDICVAGRWDKVRAFWEKKRASINAATNDTRQAKVFYEADENTLWITFYADKLWWCFSRPVVVPKDDGVTRPTIGGWHSEDIEGHELRTNQLSGKLLTLRGYRGTICEVRELPYLLNRIQAVESATLKAARQALNVLEAKLTAIIQNLHWKEFEVLVDLIFRQAGWQRASVLGETLKDLDLDLTSPITSERFGVQVKSQANIAKLNEYEQRLAQLGGFARFYFVVHSPAKSLAAHAATRSNDNIEIWLPEDVARQAVRYGLTEWILDKAK